jgi:agmatine deiminase
LCQALLPFFLSFPLPPISAAERGASPSPHRQPPARRMAAEFEKQAALLLTWDDSDLTSREVILNIVAAARNTVPIVILVKDRIEHENAIVELSRAGIPEGTVTLLRIYTDTPWVRDYGPVIVQTPDSKPLVIDAAYSSEDRSNDDLSPSSVGRSCQCPTEQTGLQAEGGNLLTNGAGLGIASLRLQELNTNAGYTKQELHSKLNEVYGLHNLVFLEPLIGEGTSHVDMFATFTGVDTVVVGSYSTDDDPENAAVLDRNAALLAGVPTSRGPLRVVRIPMPRRTNLVSDVFPTWTNVVYANRTLLVPGYGDKDHDGELDAIRTYRALLPGWHIQTIDCRAIIECGGALHCLTMNLPHLQILPLSDSADTPDLPSRLADPPLEGFRIPWATDQRSVVPARIVQPISTAFDTIQSMFAEDVPRNSPFAPGTKRGAGAH